MDSVCLFGAARATQLTGKKQTEMACTKATAMELTSTAPDRTIDYYPFENGAKARFEVHSFYVYATHEITKNMSFVSLF